HTSDWNDIYLTELVKPVPDADTIPADTSLLEVAKLFETTQTRELVVISTAGKVLGLLEKASIIKLMTKEENIQDKAAIESAQEKEKAIIN
ncbi:MAG: hypothetical protein RLZZ69_904, partial [Cyanobacteriota bacterium]